MREVPEDQASMEASQPSGGPVASGARLYWRRRRLRRLIKAPGLILALAAILISWDSGLGSSGAGYEDGSVAYYRPPLAATRTVEVTPGICYGTVKFYHDPSTPIRGDEACQNLFPLLKSTRQKNIPAVKEDARLALLNRQYTDNMQVSYSVDSGQIDPFAKGSWKSCPMGCALQFTYRGQAFSNICIELICEEGISPARPEPFCDESIGNNVYYSHRLFWCQDVPQPWMICGEGGKCLDKGDGTLTCGGSSTTAGPGSGVTVIEYAITSPADNEQPFLVAAYENGKLIASKPISDLSAKDYVLQHGPVRASQADSFARTTGLASTVDPTNLQKAHAVNPAGF